MTWGPHAALLQLDDRVAVDPTEVAIAASHGNGTSLWLRGASGNQGVYVARPFADVVRALEEARRPRVVEVHLPSATSGPEPARELADSAAAPEGVSTT